MENQKKALVKNRASITAEYMALFRALESSRPPGFRLFHDPYAATFLEGPRRWLYRIARFGPGRRLVEAVLDRGAPGARETGILRTRWIDVAAAAELEKATQLVLLGAGFDMRAYRLSAAASATIFELDYPETSLAKQAILRRALRSLPERVRYVGIDFQRRSVSEVLLQAGFDYTRPACFIWEGVTNYLKAEAVDQTLGEIRRTAAGNLLLFTYIDRGVLDHPDRYASARQLMARLASYGEPWTFGLDPRELAGFLAARGFDLIAESSIEETAPPERRGMRSLKGYEFYRLGAARVQTRHLST